MLKKVLNINFLIYFLNLHIVKILKRMNNGKKYFHCSATKVIFQKNNFLCQEESFR